LRVVKRYWVYILTNRSGTLYVGMTSNLLQRVHQHREKSAPGFTASYNLDRLVYYEEYADARDAVQRERQLKGWRRARKLALLERVNPSRRDLSDALL
jgi:putative endonuclease